MPRTGMNIVRGDVEIEVDIDYLEPEPRTWDSPGCDGEVDVGQATAVETGESIQLTDEEVADIKDNFFECLESRRSAERAFDEAQSRHESRWYPF